MLRLLPSRANSTSPCWALLCVTQGSGTQRPQGFSQSAMSVPPHLSKASRELLFPKKLQLGSRAGQAWGWRSRAPGLCWSLGTQGCCLPELQSSFPIFSTPSCQENSESCLLPKQSSPREQRACTHRVTTGAKTLPTAQQGLRRARGGALEHTWSTSGILGAPQGGQLPSSCRAEG